MSDLPVECTIYLNVWVSSRRIQEALIRFKVEESWIVTEGFTSENLRMYRWDGKIWKELETRVLSKDASSTNYEAKTDGFAYFAITGPKATTVAETTAAPTATAPGGTPSAIATAPTTEGQQPISLVYIIILIGVIAVVAYLYAASQKKK